MDGQSGSSRGNGITVTFMSHPSIWLAGRLPSAVLCALATFVLTFLAIRQSDEFIKQQEQEEVFRWLHNIGFGERKQFLYDRGCDSLASCCDLLLSPFPPVPSSPGVSSPLSSSSNGVGELYEALRPSARRLRSRLVLERWLRDHRLPLSVAARQRGDSAGSAAASDAGDRTASARPGVVDPDEDATDGQQRSTEAPSSFFGWPTPGFG
ncbi:uncharacterized protein LOC119374981 [Rhipicephalus sanguineus]|uniref:uncharacterized protein LOC119374981 n=1 Tax=Rhipicephalus sanguineus TaxID=34632 RepID=UPI001892E9DE|nr:uncharacterized protein LOC119374981 [Rhipicephalus sanguineus]